MNLPQTVTNVFKKTPTSMVPSVPSTPTFAPETKTRSWELPKLTAAHAPVELTVAWLKLHQLDHPSTTKSPESMLS